MMTKRSILVIILILSVVDLIKAQQNDLDKKYYPEKSKYFNSKGLQSTSQEKSAITKNDFLGFPFALLGRGILAVSYERMVNDYYGIEIALGKPIAKDFIFEEWTLSIKEAKDNSVIDYSEISKNSDFQSGSLYYSLGLKYFFDSDPFGQKSLSLNIRRWGYSYRVNDSYASSLRISEDSHVFSHQFNQLNLMFNYRKIYGNLSSNMNFFAESYFGVGFKAYTYFGFEEKEVYDPNLFATVKRYEKIQKNAFTITFLWGISIGLAF